jgi:hypothetical protein
MVNEQLRIVSYELIIKQEMIAVATGVATETQLTNSG